MHPFSEDAIKDHLFNISTGRSVEDVTDNFLLNAYEQGELNKLQFIKECNDDPERFKKSIKNN